MGTKAEEMKLAAEGKGCLGKAADDEPVFILRAQDRFAPGLVEAWSDRVERHVRNSPDAKKYEPKIKEARYLAHAMRAWQALHNSKTPD